MKNKPQSRGLLKYLLEQGNTGFLLIGLDKIKYCLVQLVLIKPGLKVSHSG